MGADKGQLCRYHPTDIGRAAKLMQVNLLILVANTDIIFRYLTFFAVYQSASCPCDIRPVYTMPVSGSGSQWCANNLKGRRHFGAAATTIRGSPAVLAPDED